MSASYTTNPAELEKQESAPAARGKRGGGLSGAVFLVYLGGPTSNFNGKNPVSQA
jgi:hypothetical protein